MNLLFSLFKKKEKSQAEKSSNEDVVSQESITGREKDKNIYGIYNKNKSGLSNNKNANNINFNSADNSNDSYMNKATKKTEIIKELSYQPPNLFNNLITTNQNITSNNENNKADDNLNTEKNFKFIKKKESNDNNGHKDNKVITNKETFGFKIKTKKENNKEIHNNNTLPQNTIASFKEEFQTHSNKINENVKSLFIKMLKLLKDISYQEEELKTLHQHSNKVYIKELEAVEKNNFEEAQGLEEELIQTQNKINSIKEEIEKNKQQIILIREEEIKLSKTKCITMEEFQKKINDFKINQTDFLEDYENQQSKTLNSLFCEIETLKKDFEDCNSELIKEQKDVKELESLLLTKIKSEINADAILTNLDNLKKNRSNLEEEIEKLKNELLEKITNLKSVNEEIKNVENKIEDIKLNYKDESNNLTDKKTQLEKIKESKQKYSDTLETKSFIYEEKQKVFVSKIEKMNELISEVNDTLIKLNNEMNELGNQVIFKEDLYIQEKELNSKLSKLIDNLERLKSEIKQNEELIQNTEFSIKRMESEIMSINIKIPNLDEEKKSYITLKNFKEAANVTNELKNLNEKKLQLNEDIEENRNQIDLILNKNEELKNDSEDMIEKIERDKKEMNFLKINFLNNVKMHLMSLEGVDDFDEDLKFLQTELNTFEEHEDFVNKDKASKFESTSELVVSQEICDSSINKFENESIEEIEENVNKIGEENTEADNIVNDSEIN